MRKNPHHNLSSLSFLPLSVKTVELIVCASFHCSPDDLSLSSFHGRLSKAIRLNHRGAEVSLGFFCVYLECLYINNDDEWSGRKSKIIHSTFRVNWNSSRKLLLFFWQQNARSKKVTLYPCTWTESFSEIQISTSTYIHYSKVQLWKVWSFFCMLLSLNWCLVFSTSVMRKNLISSTQKLNAWNCTSV